MPGDNAPGWDLDVAYRMVRERDHALTDRQRRLMAEEADLEKIGTALLDRAEAYRKSVATVEQAGGDATKLRELLAATEAEAEPIVARLDWLGRATGLIAANLRLLDSAHDSLHWLNFENGSLARFDEQPEVPRPLAHPTPGDSPCK